ncbi:MAG: polysaccharide biosynthesis C-terminal domain-containing protein, partial [bacterium]
TTISLFSDNLINLVYKTGFQETGMVLSVLIFYIVFYFANLPISTAIQSVGLERLFLIHYLFTPFINIGLNFYLYRSFGIVGFAYSSVAVQVFIFLFITLIGAYNMKKKHFII